MEGVTEGPAPQALLGWQTLPHGIFSLQRSIFIHFFNFLGFVLVLLSLHFYNLNSEPSEQMSDLLVIE